MSPFFLFELNESSKTTKKHTQKKKKARTIQTHLERTRRKPTPMAKKLFSHTSTRVLLLGVLDNNREKKHAFAQPVDTRTQARKVKTQGKKTT